MDVLTARTSALPLHVRAISIADREADFYDFLATDIDNQLDLLIRAVHDRRLDQEGNPRLRETVEATVPLGSVTVDIPRSAHRASYRATLELRACRVMLCTPQNAEHLVLAPLGYPGRNRPMSPQLGRNPSLGGF